MPPTLELTLPDNLETATAMLNDPVEVNKWLQNRRFAELQARFNELSAPSLPQQIADILDAREAQEGTMAQAATAAMDKWLSDHGALATINRPSVQDIKAPATLLRNEYAQRIEAIGFTNLGDFAKEIWHRNPTANRRGQINEIMNAYSSIDPAAGGALIPESFDAEIRSLALETSIVRAGATVIPMGTPQLLMPFVDWTTNVGSTFGGWTVHRVPEGGTIPRSNAKFGRVKLDVTKQVAGTEVPNEMFADVSTLDGFIRSTLPQALSFAEDIDFLTSDGAGSPLGMLHANNRALITVTKETNQPAATVDVWNILKMYARMLPSSKGNAVWLVNPTTFPYLQTLSISVGTGGAPVMLVNFANGPVPTMLGRPIIETEKVAALGAAGDIAFVDRKYYLVGDRPGSALEFSPHQEFMNDVTVGKLTARNDGRPWLQEPIQPLNGETLSAFVRLGART